MEDIADTLEALAKLWRESDVPCAAKIKKELLRIANMLSSEEPHDDAG